MNPEGSSFSLASAMNSLYGLRQTSLLASHLQCGKDNIYLPGLLQE